VSKTFTPDPADEVRLADLRIRWAEAVKRSKRWELE